MTPQRPIKVFAVIVTWNAVPWLSRCLGSLKQSRLPVDVVVVDNNSGDDTVEQITTRYPAVTLICSNANLGFGKANNAGIRRALDLGAEYVFLLNQDAWVEPDTIAQLVEISQRNPDYYVLSPLHFTAGFTQLDHSFSRYASPDNCPGLFSDMAAVQTRSGRTSLEGTEAAGTEATGTDATGTDATGTETAVKKATGTEATGTEATGTEAAGTEAAKTGTKRHIPAMKDGYETSFVNAALWLLPRRCFVTIGGFDPLFSHYGEDYDYVHRVRFFKFKVVICPLARGVHDRNQQPFVLSQIADPKRRYYRMKVDMLISLKDINRRYPRTLLQEIKRNGIALIKSALFLRPADVINHAKLLAFALLNTPVILQNRTRCRKKGAAANWLDADIVLKTSPKNEFETKKDAQNLYTGSLIS